MKKQLLIAVAILAFAVAGCKDKSKEMPSVAVPSGGMQAPQMPAAMPGQNSPHAVAGSPAQPAGPDHKGKVVETMNAAGYTYLLVDEKGQKTWAAAMATTVKVGDMVEFPASSQLMANFTSKTLNRTFDKIYFVSTLRVNGK